MRTADAARKFHFLREIASGGFGRVYLCKLVHADGFSRLAAVKVLHPKWTKNEEIAQRMRDEARLLGMLRHKNIVDVIDLTRVDGRAAVVMEYLEAVDLKMLIADAKRGSKSLPLKSMLQAFSGVASALDAAYNRPPFAGDKPLRVVHRDIKPSNVMIDGSGLTKVLDFGVARAEFEAREAKTQELSFGSVEYMSPERLFFEPESPASDVYSLGATLYETIALEKFGKAKLRVDAHEQYFAERFEDLLERHPMPSEEVEDMLHDLLYDMLAFEEASRPAASDCVTRLRAFARSLGGDGLEEWAEEAVPPVLQKLQSRPPRRQEGDSTSLVDRVLSEDTSGIASTREVEVGPTDAPPLEDAMQGAKDPARWDELKKKTLASLAGEGLGPSTSTWNPESEPVLQKALGPPPVPEGVVSAKVHDTSGKSVGGAVPKAPLPRAPGDSSEPAPTVRLDSQVVVSDGAETTRSPRPLEADFSDFDEDDDLPTVVGVAPTEDPAPELEPEPAPLPEADLETDPETEPATTQSSQQPAALQDPVEQMEKPATSSRAGGAVGLLVLGFGLALAIAVLVTVVGAGAVAMMLSSQGGAPETVVPPTPAEVAVNDDAGGGGEDTPAPVAAEEPEEDAEQPAEEAEEAAEEAPAEVTGARFVSRVENTKKISVRCDGGSASGTDVAVVEGEAIGLCTVTVLGSDRSRHKAVVKGVKPGEYDCFAAGSDTCE